ncbi:clarin-3 [Betta splendens]|uniref:Clarin-3 n=1 Tax=Betta splendens TaxID=158456 RepID=A0A6P7L7I0_BETSP|nr:clarin-3 [Betta splendens]XP_028989985.1 clarin-3 [Betta splendens]
MPSAVKMLFFLSSALATVVAVGLLGYGMSARWATVTMSCAKKGTGNFNGSALITMGLFSGELQRQFCPFGNTDKFQVFSVLQGTAVSLHAVVLVLLGLGLLFSACTILISLYNSVSNPYETFMGPSGVYACGSLSACLSFVALIIYVVNATATSMAEDVVKSDNSDVELRDQSSAMEIGYFFVVPYAVMSLVAVAVIVVYDRAAYTHRREQQRPTEDAPKEIMMY